VSTNPFVADVPLPPDQLIDREAEWRTLVDLAAGGHNARLSAPRRYGKTTLLKKVALEVEKIGMATVYVDLFGVVSNHEVAVRMEAAYHASLKGPLARWFLGVRRRWRPSVGIPTPMGRANISVGSEEDASRILHELLDLPRGIHSRSGQRTLVIFDEFQDLLAAGEGLDGIFRSRIQHHAAAASYIFAGSQPGLMTELFSSRTRPLFGQSRAIKLPPLPDGDLAEYVGGWFDETGRDAGASLEPLVSLVRGHPQRAMLMAHHLWNATPARGAADEARWGSAFRSAMLELQEGFERAWDDLTANQRRVLAAIAWIGPWGEGTSLYANDTLRRFRIAKGTVRDVLGVLIRRGDVEQAENGSARLVDPLFEAWIASGRRPPGESADGD
jgi:hypothetical protein